MEKVFSINEDGCSVRCLAYCADPRSADRVVLYGHGFGGHKETRAAGRMAQALLSKYKHAALICFDWPCHGEDGRKRISLSDCDRYLRLVLDRAREQFTPRMIWGCATSFGGFLFLKYISEHGCPFDAVALRSPAVDMSMVIRQSLLSQEDLLQLERGREVLAGFDRKVKIGPSFLRELDEVRLRERDFLSCAERILIVHGEKDEIVPIEPVRAFADEQLIEFLPIPGADHRFLDPGRMDLAISRILQFYALS